MSNLTVKIVNASPEVIANIKNVTPKFEVSITETGPRGEQGIQGIQGIQGKQGIQGEQGIQGIQGDKGDTGNGISSAVLNDDYTLTLNFTDGTQYITQSIRGLQGLQGIQGETGNGIASAVLNADYTLTLTFTDGTVYTSPSIRGEQGIQGIQGIQGKGATIAVGTVITGEADTNASVANSGTSGDAVFDFTIPRGDKGTGVSSVANVDDLRFRVNLTDNSFYDIHKPPSYSLAISVKAQFTDESQLPSSTDIGAMYLVNQDLYIYTVNGWINTGSIIEVDYDLFLNIDCGLFTDTSGGIDIGESALEALGKHIVNETTHFNLIIDGQEDYAQ